MEMEKVKHKYIVMLLTKDEKAKAYRVEELGRYYYFLVARRGLVKAAKRYKLSPLKLGDSKIVYYCNCNLSKILTITVEDVVNEN